MTRIGMNISGGYVDRPIAVGTVVAQHDCYVEWAVAGEPTTRVMLNRVADERVITERATLPYPQTHREPQKRGR